MQAIEFPGAEYVTGKPHFCRRNGKISKKTPGADLSSPAFLRIRKRVAIPAS